MNSRAKRRALAMPNYTVLRCVSQSLTPRSGSALKKQEDNGISSRSKLFRSVWSSTLSLSSTRDQGAIMAATVSDFIVSRLHEWGVKRLYGYSGDGINGVMSALRRADGAPRLIQPRHEDRAANMACVHAMFSDEVGVCAANAGPGAVHLLSHIYDARKDHMPVVDIVGQHSRMSLGTDYQQVLGLMALVNGVAGAYVQMY